MKTVKEWLAEMPQECMNWWLDAGCNGDGVIVIGGDDAQGYTIDCRGCEKCQSASKEAEKVLEDIGVTEPRTETSQAETGRFVACPKCATSNGRWRTRCVQCGELLSESVRPTAKDRCLQPDANDSACTCCQHRWYREDKATREQRLSEANDEAFNELKECLKICEEARHSYPEGDDRRWGALLCVNKLEDRLRARTAIRSAERRQAGICKDCNRPKRPGGSLCVDCEDTIKLKKHYDTACEQLKETHTKLVALLKASNTIINHHGATDISGEKCVLIGLDDWYAFRKTVDPSFDPQRG